MATFRVTIKGVHNIGSQEVNNIYFYQNVGNVPVSVTLPKMESFARSVIQRWSTSGILGITSVQMRYTGATIDEVLPDGTLGASGGATYPTPVAGTYTGDAMPPHDAYAITLVRRGRPFRNGYKRFAGVPEGLTNNGIIPDASTITTLRDVGNTMCIAPMPPAPDISADDNFGGTWYYVVQKTVQNSVPLPSPLYAPPIGVIVDTFISTQNSRKARR